jgi:4-hydroxybenzoate polyprenyltransferase
MNTINLSFDRGWAYLQMMRPANIITAWADVLVGVAISGMTIDLVLSELGFTKLLCLLVSTTGLYGGGVVMNDLCDAAIDGEERPERPIPSQRASISGAAFLTSSLLIIGIAAAAQVSSLSAMIALGIVVASILYNTIAKHHTFWGPLNMGLCRGGNWLLGVSFTSAMVTERWYLALMPLLYVAAITAISQGEVWGGKHSTGAIALSLLGMVIGSVFLLGLLPNFYLLSALPFVLVFGIRVLPCFVLATRDPSAERIRLAVTVGVLSLILLDASVAAGFSGLAYGAIVLLLLPLSITLGQRFAVT